MKSCDSTRQLLLELDLDEAGRQRAAGELKHLEGCEACRAALREFDALREAFAPFDPEVEPTGGWTDFQRRMTARAAQPSSKGRWARSLAIAASVLIVAAAFEFGMIAARWGEPGAIPAKVALTVPEESDSHFAPAPGDITHEVSAFHQVSQIFDGRAGWMLMSKQTSDVGVVDGNVDATGKVLLLRLTVTAAGREISDADLLVIPGQTANLTVPLEEGAALRYRIGTSTDEPTHLALWLEVRTPTGAEPLAALSTNLRLQPGQKVTAGELSTSSGRYVLKVGYARVSLPSGGRP